LSEKKTKKRVNDDDAEKDSKSHSNQVKTQLNPQEKGKHTKKE